MATARLKSCIGSNNGEKQVVGFAAVNHDSRTSTSVLEVFWRSSFSTPVRDVGAPVPNIGALIIGIGFWGPLCYNYNKGPPK